MLMENVVGVLLFSFFIRYREQVSIMAMNLDLFTIFQLTNFRGFLISAIIQIVYILTLYNAALLSFNEILCFVLEVSSLKCVIHNTIRESSPQFENQIMGWVYVRSITRNTMYQTAPFC